MGYIEIVIFGVELLCNEPCGIFYSPNKACHKLPPQDVVTGATKLLPAFRAIFMKRSFALFKMKEIYIDLIESVENYRE